MSEEEIVTIWREEGLEEIMTSAKDALIILKQFPEASKEISLEMKRGSRAIFAQRRALMAIRTEWRTAHAEIIEVTRAMSAVGAMGKTIVSMWQAYTLAQTRVADAARDFRLAQVGASLAQDELNRLQSHGITSGEEYYSVVMKLNKAKEDSAARSRELAAAQQENIVGYVGMGLQSLGLVSNLVDLSYHMAVIKSIHAASTPLIAAETVAQGGLTSAIWAGVTARIAWLATHPAGWAILAGAAIVGGAAIAYWASQRSMRHGGVIPETGWYFLHRKETVVPARTASQVVVNFNPTIYGEEGREEAFEDLILTLRGMGLM